MKTLAVALAAFCLLNCARAQKVEVLPESKPNPFAFPLGSYKPDVSQAPRNARDGLTAYWGRAYLVIGLRDQFSLAGINQYGYWRKSGERYVFIYNGFFSLQKSDPAEVLRKAWPEGVLDGFVLRKGPKGTLILDSWGRNKGPVIFRPMPKRTVSELLVTSYGDDFTAANEEAQTLLNDRVETEWPEFLRFANDPKRTGMQRVWAAILLGNLRDPKGIESTAQLILGVKPTTDNRDYSIRRSLARVVCRKPTDRAADLLIQGLKKGLLVPSDVAPALGSLKRRKDVPLLLEWLNSAREYDKTESLEALTLIGMAEALPDARRLTTDPKERVQLMAYGLIARTSLDAQERKVAIQKLGAWSKSSTFLIPADAMDALCRSGAPEALPYLVAMLSSDMDSLYRRNVASALGRLGDERAVPALIEAKLREGGPGGLVPESEVNRAAAEALVQIGKAKQRKARAQ